MNKTLLWKDVGNKVGGRGREEHRGTQPFRSDNPCLAAIATEDIANNEKIPSANSEKIPSANNEKIPSHFQGERGGNLYLWLGLTTYLE